MMTLHSGISASTFSDAAIKTCVDTVTGFNDYQFFRWCDVTEMITLRAKPVEI